MSQSFTLSMSISYSFAILAGSCDFHDAENADGIAESYENRIYSIARNFTELVLFLIKKLNYNQIAM